MAGLSAAERRQIEIGDLERKNEALLADNKRLREAVEFALSCGIMTETVCEKFEQALKEK